MSIDRGNHPAAVPVVPIVSRARGEHRPGQASAVPVVPVVTSIDGKPSRGRVDRRRGLVSIDQGKHPAAVSVLSIVAGLVTSIDQGKRQPAPVSIIDQGNHPAAVAVLPIVAGLVSIDRGKRLDQGNRQPVPAVPIIDRGNHPRPSPALSIVAGQPGPWCRSSPGC